MRTNATNKDVLHYLRNSNVTPACTSSHAYFLFFKSNLNLYLSSLTCYLFQSFYFSTTRFSLTLFPNFRGSLFFCRVQWTTPLSMSCPLCPEEEGRPSKIWKKELNKNKWLGFKFPLWKEIYKCILFLTWISV